MAYGSQTDGSKQFLIKIYGDLNVVTTSYSLITKWDFFSKVNTILNFFSKFLYFSRHYAYRHILKWNERLWRK